MKGVRNGQFVHLSYTTVRRTPAPVRLYVRSRFFKKRTVVHRRPRGRKQNASHLAFRVSKWMPDLGEGAGMTTRQSLPDGHGHELLDFEHGGIRYTAGAERFEDGRVPKSS